MDRSYKKENFKLRSLKIRIKKWRRYTNLISGIVWFCLGCAFLYIEDTSSWTNYLYFLISLSFVGHFLYDEKHHYLRIENGIIKPNRLYGMKARIEIDKIQSITQKWGDYRIETPNKTLSINTQIIDKDSLEDLVSFFKSLKLPEDKLMI